MMKERGNNKKVFVLMSGGVDSSVAAALMKKQGYEVTGVHLVCWGDSPVGEEPGCTAGEDRADAERAAAVLDIPLEIWDLRKEYAAQVFKYMIDGYRKGITPNPDVMCNREIKFGAAMTRARAAGADYVATGHYTRQWRETLNPKSETLNSEKKYVYYLREAKDKSKDQSYFLWTLTQEQLKHCLFPIGDYLKSEVREMARKFGLPNAEKKDSQGLCFVGKVAFQDFLSRYLPERPGEVMTARGEVVGRHRGTHYYTIGQRRGIGVEGGAAPYYVAAKDAVANVLVVAEKAEPQRSVWGADIEGVVAGAADLTEAAVRVRTRYRQKLVEARIKFSGKKRGEAEVLFNEPVAAVAPGQSLVAYGKRGEVVAGGVIREVIDYIVSGD